MANASAAWPASTISLVTGINASRSTLASLVAVCQSEGIRRQNYRLIIELLPRLAEESSHIYDNARMIRAQAPRRPGRPAKWVTVTENVIALAIKLMDATADTDDNIPANHWSVIAMLLSIMEQALDQVEAEMGQVALDGVPEVFREAL